MHGPNETSTGENGFDAYYEWLGIPPAEQPASHYRLLGISAFETNPKVIQNAADRVMGQLRGFQTGARGRESQKILNEVTQAKICLLDASRKAKYDAELKKYSNGNGNGNGHSNGNGTHAIDDVREQVSKHMPPVVPARPPVTRTPQKAPPPVIDDAVVSIDIRPKQPVRTTVTPTVSQKVRGRQKETPSKLQALLGKPWAWAAGGVAAVGLAAGGLYMTAGEKSEKQKAAAIQPDNTPKAKQPTPPAVEKDIVQPVTYVPPEHATQEVAIVKPVTPEPVKQPEEPKKELPKITWGNFPTQQPAAEQPKQEAPKQPEQVAHVVPQVVVPPKVEEPKLTNAEEAALRSMVTALVKNEQVRAEIASKKYNHENMAPWTKGKQSQRDLVEKSAEEMRVAVKDLYQKYDQILQNPEIARDPKAQTFVIKMKAGYVTHYATWLGSAGDRSASSVFEFLDSEQLKDRKDIQRDLLTKLSNSKDTTHWHLSYETQKKLFERLRMITPEMDDKDAMEATANLLIAHSIRGRTDEETVSMTRRMVDYSIECKMAGEDKLAASLISKARAIKLRNPKRQGEVAKILSDKDSIERALKKLETSPKDKIANITAGDFYMRTGKPNESLKKYHAADEINRFNARDLLYSKLTPTSYIERADGLMRMVSVPGSSSVYKDGVKELALQLYRRALEDIRNGKDPGQFWNMTKDRVEKIVRENPGTAVWRLEGEEQVEAKKGEWVELKDGINVATGLSGKWEKTANGVKTSEAPLSRILVNSNFNQAQKQHGYSFTTSFIRHTNKGNAIVILFPVRNNQCTLVLDGWSRNEAALDGPRVFESTKIPLKLNNGSEYIVEGSIKIINDNAVLSFSLNGKNFMNWSGKISDLEMHPTWSVGNPGLGFGAYESEAELRSFKIKE